MQEEEETLKLAIIKPQASEDHRFHDHFIATTVSDEALAVLKKHNIEYDGIVIHFKKCIKHPGFGRSIVTYPDENDTLVTDRTWEMPDGSIIGHSTKEGIVRLWQ